MDNKLMITFDKLEPDPSLRERTRRKIYHRPGKRNIRVTRFISFAAVILCAVLCIYVHVSNTGFRCGNRNPMNIPLPEDEIKDHLFFDSPDDPEEAFMYNNHYYIWVGTRDYDTVKELLDRELADSDELESTGFGILTDMKIYSVTGYDENVLLIGIVEKTDGIRQARIYAVSI